MQFLSEFLEKNFLQNTSFKLTSLSLQCYFCFFKIPPMTFQQLYSPNLLQECVVWNAKCIVLK